MTLKVLYGSKARGDSDEQSDTDVLHVDCQGRAGAYSWSEMNRMAKSGSLFLLHLKNESRIISGSRSERAEFKRLLESLQEYGGAAKDLDSFEIVVDDVLEALGIGDTPLVFEAQVTAKLVRHLAILGCYMAGEPNFSRYDSVELAADLWNVKTPGSSSSGFVWLYSSISSESWEGNSGMVKEWLAFAQSLIAKLRVKESGGRLIDG